MPIYQFYLNTCKITNTRSFIKDTLIVGLGVQVNNTVVSVVAHQIGNFDNGTFTFWEKGVTSIDQVLINPTDSVTFMYQIYNNGHDHQPDENLMRGTISQDLNNAMGQFQVRRQAQDKRGEVLPIVKGDPDTGNIADGETSATADPELDADGDVGSDPPVQEDFFTGGLYSLFKFIFKSCDGPVALGVFSTTGADLEARIAKKGGQAVIASQTFSGKACKYGAPCNASGSDYVVTWIFQHH